MPPGPTVMFAAVAAAKGGAAGSEGTGDDELRRGRERNRRRPSHRVAAGEAQRAVVGERLICRDLDGNAGPHVQRCARRHGEAAGEDIAQVRRVGPDQVEVELIAAGKGASV